MSNSSFRFQRFTVRQDRCAMKVGTDGVLLGAWVDVAACRRALDAGAGTGLIALMMAQRNGALQVDGVEIDPEACRQAAANASASPFAARIRLYGDSFSRFSRAASPCYDLIVSNPPYFVRSLRCPDEKRRLARHDDLLSLAGLLSDSLPLLTPGGRMALILPFRQEEELRVRAEACGLHCIRRTEVCFVEGAAPKRLLVELARRARTSVETGRLTLMDLRRQRTAAYRELTRDFYLETVKDSSQA
ncbi:MAG: methyltransferase [Tannerella sp.]|jgi:tRNA1Val (adenine37-N6)-methyltransferase|nr:methyltransferase [Tannerella sp.]